MLQAVEEDDLVNLTQVPKYERFSTIQELMEKRENLSGFIDKTTSSQFKNGIFEQLVPESGIPVRSQDHWQWKLEQRRQFLLQENYSELKHGAGHSPPPRQMLRMSQPS